MLIRLNGFAVSIGEEGLMVSNLRAQEQKVLQIVEQNQGCTSAQLGWIFCGGIVRNDALVGTVTVEPESFVASKNVSARLTRLLEMGKVKREGGRYFTSIRTPRRRPVEPPVVEDEVVASDRGAVASHHVNAIKRDFGLD